MWSGCSSLFFTLNPHDIRSPITLLLLQDDVKFDKKFSLDWPDERTAEFVTSFIKDDARRLQKAVASNPLVGTRCFHWTCKLVVRILFNCEDSPGFAFGKAWRSADSHGFGLSCTAT